MALSADQETILRTWVGDDPTNAELEALYAIHESWDEVVRSTLRRKIALLSEDPTSLSVPGLSISNGQQITTLQQLLRDFNNSGGTGLDETPGTGGFTISKVVRANASR